MLLMGFLQWVAPPSFDDLVYHRQKMIEQAQWWRMWSGHLVHWTPYHFALNALGLLVWVLLCPRRWTLTQWIVILAWLGGGVSLWLLLVQPDMIRYAGFSGVLHGLFLMGLVPQAARRDRIALLCLLYLVVKIIWEQALGVPLSDAERIGAAVATDAHLAGVLAAVMLLLGGHYKQQGLAARRV
ncbi:rhombosortase [Algiphilus sp.]|uniref:rhombosortase n=1 Tax=Algiphilus sp. TaxID=1872431 RepID=UPI003B520B9D